MAQKLLNLQSSDYEHPFDKSALETMRNLPMFGTVTNFVLNWTTIKWRIVNLCGSSFHVTDSSCPELYKIIRDAARTLDIDHIPEVYSQWDYGINAYTTGFDKDTILVLYSGAVDLLPDPELTYIIGHELGHVKSGHVLYHVMAGFITQIINAMGLLGKFAEPIKLALLYWNRMSEFTADRAGLLACQDLDAVISAIMKMSGIPKRYFNIADPHIFAEQAQEFLTRYGDTANTIIRNISILDDSHPWTVMRAAELIKWVENGEYASLLARTSGITCPACGSEIEKGLSRCPVCGNIIEDKTKHKTF